MFVVLKGVLAAACIALPVGVSASNLSAECDARDEASCLISMVLAYYANQSYGIDIGVEERSADATSALYLAANQLSLAVVKPGTYEMLETGQGVFRSNPDQATAAAKRLRALFGVEDDQGQLTTIAVNEKMGYALAYNITAAFWNNFPSIRREVVELNENQPPFVGVNMPMHPGALKYFESKGYDVPTTLR